MKPGSRSITARRIRLWARCPEGGATASLRSGDMAITLMHSSPAPGLSSRPVTGCLHGTSGEDPLYPRFVATEAFGRPRSTDPRLRGALLLPLGILAVHQLRF